MSYNNLHLLDYRRQRPSSIISAENIESNSDNINKQIIIPSSSVSTPTAILINIQNKRQSKLCFLNNNQQKQFNNKPKTNILVDYCTYHDVAVPRVTCL
jgi:hypothetical protein